MRLNQSSSDKRVNTCLLFNEQLAYFMNLLYSLSHLLRLKRQSGRAVRLSLYDII